MEHYEDFDRDENGLFVGTVYMYTLTAECPRKGQRYIGCTISEKERIQDFFQTNTPYAGKDINEAIKLYGPEAFERTVLMRLTGTDRNAVIAGLKTLEEFFIRKFDTVRNGFNLSYSVGKAAIGVTVVDTIQNISTPLDSMSDVYERFGYREGSVRHWLKTGKTTKTGLRFEYN